MSRMKILLLIFWLSLSAFAYGEEPLPSSLELDFKNLNLREALRLSAKWSGRNILISPKVLGQVSLHLQNAKAAEVFELLLKMHGLRAWQSGNLWVVVPAENLLKQREQDSKWREADEAADPLLLQLWQLHYARAQDLARWLQAEHSSWLSKQGHLQVDSRTNTLCVEDHATRVAAIERILKRLDVPVKQVLIEARLISIDSDYEKELGLRFSVQGVESAGHEGQRQGEFSLLLARLADKSLLDIKLAALEKAGHGELISSPSLYTASGQAASIEAGEEIPYQEASSSGATSLVFKKAVLSLKVSPQILPSKKILLQLQVNQDRPSNRMVLGVPTIATRQMMTNVLVGSGHTVVLGGIYESSQENSREGLPFLSKLPVLAWFFEVKADRKAKRELLVFVTPKIIE